MSEHRLAPTDVTRASGQPMPIGDLMLVLGDSLAVGIGAGHVSEGGMAQLAAWLAERHPRLAMVNLAIPSESSTSMVAPGGQLDRAVEAMRRAEDRAERIGPVTLSLGANDSIEAAVLGEAEARRRYSDNLNVVFERLSSAAGGPRRPLCELLCVQTFYNPFPACDTVSGLPAADALAPRRARTLDFNEALLDIAGRYGVRVADVAAAFRGRELELTWLRTGDIHPNPLGQRAIRDAHIVAGGWR